MQQRVGRGGSGGVAGLPNPPIGVYPSYFHPPQVARGGMQALRERQKSDVGGALTPELRRSLIYWMNLLHELTPKQIDISGKRQAHSVFYSDAFWDPDPSAPSCLPPVLKCHSGLGACMYDNYGLLEEAAAVTPSKCLLMLNSRETQIIPCELFALVGGVFTFASHLSQSRVILFVDHISVACAVAKGSTTCSDLSGVITDFHTFMTRIRCSWWMEWTPSESNPADILSREGRYRNSVIPLDMPEWAT